MARVEMATEATGAVANISLVLEFFFFLLPGKHRF